MIFSLSVSVCLRGAAGGRGRRGRKKRRTSSLFYLSFLFWSREKTSTTKHVLLPASLCLSLPFPCPLSRPAPFFGSSVLLVASLPRSPEGESRPQKMDVREMILGSVVEGEKTPSSSPSPTDFDSLLSDFQGLQLSQQEEESVEELREKYSECVKRLENLHNETSTRLDIRRKELGIPDSLHSFAFNSMHLQQQKVLNDLERATRIKLIKMMERRWIETKSVLSSESSLKLKSWFDSHPDHPYPSPSEKQSLAQECGISVSQVTTWFCNRRSRLKIKSIQSSQSDSSLHLPPSHHQHQHQQHSDIPSFDSDPSSSASSPSFSSCSSSSSSSSCSSPSHSSSSFSSLWSSDQSIPSMSFISSDSDSISDPFSHRSHLTQEESFIRERDLFEWSEDDPLFESLDLFGRSEEREE